MRGKLSKQLELGYFQGCNGIVLCIDLSDVNSIERLKTAFDLFQML